MQGGKAVLSADGVYRYQLLRRWGRGASIVAFVMLNPSTADAHRDDATIRRCIAFAKRWGHDGLVVVNLFAYRATDPTKLDEAADPVGPDNDDHIRQACQGASRVVCAWGAHPKAAKRAPAVVQLLPRGIQCLGLTSSGHPRHPLYMANRTRPTHFHLGSEGSLTKEKIGSRGPARQPGGAQGTASAKGRRIARTPVPFAAVMGRATGTATSA